MSFDLDFVVPRSLFLSSLFIVLHYFVRGFVLIVFRSLFSLFVCSSCFDFANARMCMCVSVFVCWLVFGSLFFV